MARTSVGDHPVVASLRRESTRGRTGTRNRHDQYNARLSQPNSSHASTLSRDFPIFTAARTCEVPAEHRRRRKTPRTVESRAAQVGTSTSTKKEPNTAAEKLAMRPSWASALQRPALEK